MPICFLWLLIEFESLPDRLYWVSWIHRDVTGMMVVCLGVPAFFHQANLHQSNSHAHQPHLLSLKIVALFLQNLCFVSTPMMVFQRFQRVPSRQEPLQFAGAACDASLWTHWRPQRGAADHWLGGGPGFLNFLGG